MPSINGIAIKSVSTFQTMDGGGFTCNVYIDNKKAGQAGDGGFGGPVEIAIADKYSEEFSKRVKEYYEINPALFSGEEQFINELIELWEAEKQFKKNTKKGFHILIAMEFRGRNEPFTYDKPYRPDVMVGVREQKYVAGVLKEYNPAEYTVFKQLEDFSVTNDKIAKKAVIRKLGKTIKNLERRNK